MINEARALLWGFIKLSICSNYFSVIQKLAILAWKTPCIRIVKVFISSYFNLEQKLVIHFIVKMNTRSTTRQNTFPDMNPTNRKIARYETEEEEMSVDSVQLRVSQ